jgi:hypothetical protein
MPLARKMIEAYAMIGKETESCHTLTSLLVPDQQANLEKYTSDRGLIGLIHDYPTSCTTLPIWIESAASPPSRLSSSSRPLDSSAL